MHILPAGLATPSPSMTVDPDVVTPGFIGFVAIALVAVVVGRAPKTIEPEAEEA